MVLRFDGTVREDQSWRGALSGAEQWEILQRTSPLSQTFGYSADEP